MESKKCTKCGEIKQLEQFQKASRNKDGLQTNCKLCTSIDVKRRRAKRNEINNWPKKTEPCKKCGGTVFQKSGKCSACASETFSKWLDENRDKRNSQQAEYRAKNKDKTKSATLKWRSENTEKVIAAYKAYSDRNKDRIAKRASEYGKKNRQRISEQQRRYREINKEKVMLRIAAYNIKNKERRNAKKREWDKRNPGAHIRHNNARRARKQNNGGFLSKGIQEKLLELQRGMCACCKKKLGNDYHLDHIIPLSLGGTNTDDNVQLLHSKCNLKKHAKHPIDYMQSIGFLL